VYGEVSKGLRQVLEGGDEDARRRAAIVLAYHASPEANRLLFDVMGGVATGEESQTVVEVRCDGGCGHRRGEPDRGGGAH